MEQYLALGRHILAHGVDKADRTGTGTRSIFGYQMRFSLQEGFPLVTTKDLSGFRLDNIIEELLWFISGDTDVRTLMAKGVNIWNRDAYALYLRRAGDAATLTYTQFVERLKEGGLFSEAYGDLGPIYGAQWRSWKTAQGNYIDQLRDVVQRIQEDPDDRGLIVSAWNPGEIPYMALRPCHTLFQFYVSNNTLSSQLYQRSCDYFLGASYNIASYSLLTMMVAHCLDMAPGEFVHTIGDAHIYTNHIPQVQQQLERTPRPLPTVSINPFQKDLFSFTRDDFELEGYDPHEALYGAQSY